MGDAAISLPLRALERDVQLPGHPHEIGERRRRHLLHDAAAMNLERDFADAKLRGATLPPPRCPRPSWKHVISREPKPP
jgi:hypothetical protein